MVVFMTLLFRKMFIALLIMGAALSFSDPTFGMENEDRTTITLRQRVAEITVEHSREDQIPILCFLPRNETFETLYQTIEEHSTWKINGYLSVKDYFDAKIPRHAKIEDYIFSNQLRLLYNENCGMENKEWSFTEYTIPFISPKTLIKCSVRLFESNKELLTVNLLREGTFAKLYKKIDALGICRKDGLLYPNNCFATMIFDDTNIWEYNFPSRLYLVYN